MMHFGRTAQIYLVTGTLIVFLAAGSVSGSPEAIRPAPELKGRLVGGGKVDLSRLLQEKKPKETWVLFWATWCAPCAFELPELEKLWKELRGNGFELVTVNEESMNPDMAWATGLPDYLKMMKISFPVIEDEAGKLASAWGLDGRLPTLFRINSAGEIVAREIGFSEILFREREKGLKERLGVTSKKEP